MENKRTVKICQIKFLEVYMEKEIVREIMKECRNWKERLLVKLFSRMFINTYKIGIKSGFNWCNKNVR